MTALTFRVAGNPIPWARTRVVTYPRLRFVNPTALTEWQDQVARAAIIALRQSEWRLVGQYTVAATFRLPVPPSWSNKKRLAMIGQPHAQKPDIDNLLKAILETMSKPVANRPRAWLMDDDAQIVDARVRKVWAAAEDAGVTVEVKMFTEAGK